MLQWQYYEQYQQYVRHYSTTPLQWNITESHADIAFYRPAAANTNGVGETGQQRTKMQKLHYWSKWDVNNLLQFY